MNLLRPVSRRITPRIGRFYGTVSLDQLKNDVPDVEFSTNSYELDRHGHGECMHPSAPPDVVVTPKTVEEVVAVVKHCNQHKIPLIAFGAGTSLEGHVQALEGGISLDMTAFQDMDLPSSDYSDGFPDAIATVGAGVTRKTLNEALRHTGLGFVVDPGADATLGGMVSCGASGTTTVRYGAMRENLLGLECVLADGTVCRTGTNALKNSAGYDMTSLLCGSEGTLGIITSVTVKLHPLPDFVVAAVCAFDTLEQAANAVIAMKYAQLPLARCELLDAASMAAFNATRKDASDRKEVKPTLFLEFQGSSEASLQEPMAQTERVCIEDFGGSQFQYTQGEEARKELWAARHTLGYAAISLRPGASKAVITDACVPLSQFATVLQATAQDVERLGVVGPCFGHAGDGNFHCILPVKPGEESEEYLNKVYEVNDNLIQRTLKAGGTCTGEHGIGMGKIKYLEPQYGKGGVHMMQLVKKALDPNNILNPGKVLPSVGRS